jgi:ribonucleoside-triphosphate reductase
MLYITKRDGRKEPFNKRKIERAMEKAYLQVDGEVDDYAEEKIHNIANFIEHKVEGGENLGVEDIQDLVENGLMNTKDKDVARAYIIYRNDRNRARGNFIDNTIEEIAESKSEYWNTENSNKNSVIVTTQRDYFAGAISTDYTMRKLLPKDVAEAHSEGIIHFHKKNIVA